MDPAIAKELSSIGLDRLMERLTPAGGAMTQSRPLKKLQEPQDCLASGNQGNVALPTYKKKVPVQGKKGISIAGRVFAAGRYLGPGFDSKGSSTPGPIYEPKYESRTGKASAFTKALRMKDAKHQRAPGPKYDIPSTLGAQHIRSSSPACRIGQAERFNEKIHISAGHAKTQPNSNQLVGPATYETDTTMVNTGPAYSFGGTITNSGEDSSSCQRFNEKVFISSGHSKTMGGSTGPGPQPHVTKYTVCGPNFEFGSRYKKAPQTKFSGTTFGGELAVRRRNEARPDSPGPGQYQPDLQLAKGNAPAFSFGMHADTSKMFVSSALSTNAGRESPGPKYYPDSMSNRKTAPAFSFADADQENSLWKSRFENNRYIGSGIGVVYGLQSPGPAVYDPGELPVGPAFTMGARERILMKRICPAPQRARYVSKEQAKDNLGCFSPGPKYMPPSAFDAHPHTGKTFGISDRHFSGEAADSIGLEGGKLLRSPGEARFIGKAHVELNKGRYGPGPKYNVDGTVLKTFENMDANGTVTSTSTTAYSVDSRHRTAPAVSIGGRYESKTDCDSRMYNPDHSLTRKALPCFSFGTANRSGIGSCGQKADIDTGSSRGVKSDQDKRSIDCSPGPGAFTPHYTAVVKHTPTPALGGLSRGSEADEPKRPPKAPKTA
ncbi:hypothetical protein DIPPA_12201 [Diplonema papillatum]|nr:hypothetical protein DIPPA_12201 [Diplonema papillatum]